MTIGKTTMVTHKLLMELFPKMNSNVTVIRGKNHGAIFTYTKKVYPL